MAAVYKNLGGGSYPSANVLTDLYTVPGATEAIVSSIVCANRGDRPAKVTVTHAIAGAADEAKQTIVPETRVPAKEPYILTIGPTLAATDVVRVKSDSGTVAFNMYGAEKT